jgi:type IV pilus assembly protein PilC
MLTHQEIARLCRSAGLLIHSGIGLADGFFLLAQEETSAQKDGLEAIGAAMDSGIPLSETMEKSGMFPPYVFRLVRIGEETGRVEEALNALAEYFEEQERIRRQIRSAVAYPSLVFFLMLAVLAVLLV